jgi:hypothetical protein
MDGIGERVLAAALRLLPASRRDLGKALVAEARVVPSGRRRRLWLSGGLWFVAREVVVYRFRYGLAVTGAVAAVAAVDRMGTSDDSSQVSLLVLLVAASALGFAVPRRAWVAGLAVGSTLALVGLAEAALGVWTANLPKPGGAAGAATLFVLLVPAFAAAYAGVGARRLLRGSR